MENAKEVIESIASNITQKSSSIKDEITVMKAIMNDPDYMVTVHDKNGSHEYFPSHDIRSILTRALVNITHISNKEAKELVNHYEFNKSDAKNMINFSKEFINSYIQTGRKLPLGGRPTSNVELIWKHINERLSSVPDRDNSNNRIDTKIPAHDGIKVYNHCPKWLKNK